MSGRATVNSRHRTIVSPLPDIRRRRQDQLAGTPPPDDDDVIPETPDPDRRRRDEDDLFADHQNPNPDRDLEPDEDLEPEVPNLADAIAMLAQTLQQPRDAPAPQHFPSKVREPDQFDGLDSRKLRAFLVQLAINFQDRPMVFREDRTKVNYALSYLKGTALEWFEPGLFLTGLMEPTWLTSWVVFENELRTNFGPHDPTGDAEAELERLQMKDGHRITKYIVEFNRLSSQLQWGESALKYQFYRGLPPRIKDEISRVGKPVLLSQLRALAQSIDARYHERKSEIAREHPAPKGNPASAKPNSDQQNKSGPSSKPHEKKPDNSDRSGSRPTSSKPNAVPANRNPELQGKLGKDGKLTAEERQRRFDQKLCMFCGGPGHLAANCTKRNKDAKARNANIKTAESATAAESSDSKK
jgi:hypothetical protein